MRRDSWRSVPITRKPPASITCWWRVCHASRSLPCLLSAALANSASNEPPRTISVPRPAMFVAIVTALGCPAWAITCDSLWWCLAFSTWCLIFALFSNLERYSETAIDAVPIKVGCPASKLERMSSRMASNFSSSLMNTASGSSSRIMSL